MKPLLILPFLVLLASCVMPGSRQGVDVVLPMHFRADVPHVMASINRRAPVPMLLDSGASVTAFETSVATQNAIAAIGVRTKLKGIHGEALASQGMIHTLDIGPLHQEHVNCFIQAGAGSRPGGLGVAILGINLFSHQCSFITYDYRARRVEISYSRPFVPQTAGITRTPFRLVGGIPEISVTSDGITWNAVVDTGSTWGIVVDQATATKLGQPHGGMPLGPGMLLSGFGGSVRADEANARIITAPEVSLCGQSFRGAKLYVMPGPNRIGSRFWHGCRLTLDFRTNTLWLER